MAVTATRNADGPGGRAPGWSTPASAGSPPVLARTGGSATSGTGALHPAAVAMLAELDAFGTFSPATWRSLTEAMEALTDAEVTAVLEALARAIVPRG